MWETSRVSVSEELNECIGEQDEDAVVDNDLTVAEYLNDDTDGGSIWWGRAWRLDFFFIIYTKYLLYVIKKFILALVFFSSFLQQQYLWKAWFISFTVLQCRSITRGCHTYILYFVYNPAQSLRHLFKEKDYIIDCFYAPAI